MVSNPIAEGRERLINGDMGFSMAFFSRELVVAFAVFSVKMVLVERGGGSVGQF
jgi:hypothetical protein